MRPHKTHLFLTLIILLLICIIGFIIFLNTHPQPVQNDTSDTVFPTSVPLLYKSPRVLSIKPDITHGLLPGKTQIFTVVFNESIRNGHIKILLTKKPLQATEESSISVPITSNLKSFGKEMDVETSENIQAAHEYSLIVLDKEDTTLISVTYMTANIDASYSEKNNLELKQYLPQETQAYKLSYLERRNVYIFNFIYNPNLPTNIQEQYDQAKQQAEEFIRSKGIDLNTIVIEWRHS